jgi:electron transport complex protein RnfC
VSIRLTKKTTKHGVPLPKLEVPATGPIEPAPLPKQVVLPLHQDSAAPIEILIKKGDAVLTGQKIADSPADSSVAVHASIQGEVLSVATAVNPSTGKIMKTAVIKMNGGDESAKQEPVKSIESLSKEELIAKIRDAGIFSIGNGSSPIHLKLELEPDKKIDTVILNGCDTELYTSANYHLLLEYGQEVLSGLDIITRILSPDSVQVAIPDSRQDATETTEKLITSNKYNYNIVPVEIKYPVVEEKVLIHTLTDRAVPYGGASADIGVEVFDAGTAKAIHEAVYEGKPYIDRIVTVTGAVKTPKNLLVRFGTAIKTLIDHCGGTTDPDSQIIAGGPIKGTEQFNLDSPLSAEDNCVLATTIEPVQVMSCINCAHCVEVCPMGLRPYLYPRFVTSRHIDECVENYIDNCTECGTCAYVCPSYIPILEYIRIAKKELSKEPNNNNEQS